mgnify:CR=1 FL=1
MNNLDGILGPHTAITHLIQPYLLPYWGIPLVNGLENLYTMLLMNKNNLIMKNEPKQNIFYYLIYAVFYTIYRWTYYIGYLGK